MKDLLGMLEFIFNTQTATFLEVSVRRTLVSIILLPVTV